MSSKTILFIHGNFVNYECWDGWVQRFTAQGYKCVAISYPERNKSVAELRAEHPNPKVAGVSIDDVINHIIGEIGKLDEKPIIIGHSFGGMLTQLMINRDLGVAGVAIDSVPPQGVLSFKFSFLRSTSPLLNPLTSSPWLMPFKHFQYAFANGMSVAEQRLAYEQSIVPESVRVSRGGLGPSAHVDFKKAHPPLLLIGGEIDHIMPASLNKANYKRYQASAPSITEFKEFKGRNHYSVIAGDGWEEVADYALSWANKQTATANVNGHHGKLEPVRAY